MPEKKLLIIYSTRYGSTEGIAEKMAEIAQEKQIKAEVINLKNTSLNEITDFQNYDGILMGSSIKIGQWTKDMKKFIESKKEAINAYKGIKGFFVSSAFAASPERYEDVKIRFTIAILEKYGVKVDIYEAFGGLLDTTENSKMSWLDKKIMMMVRKREAPPDTEFEPVIDLRDWDKIEKFTIAFLEKL